LAFTSHGDTHLEGKYKKTVKRGLDYLYSKQRNGFFGNDDPDGYETTHPHAPAYNHMVATYALADCLTGEPDDAKLRNHTRAAVDRILAMRNAGAGWRYRDYEKEEGENQKREEHDGYGINDSSVTAWAVMALVGADHADIKVDHQVFRDVESWLARVADTSKPGKIMYGYSEKDQYVNSKVFVTTSCGLICQQFMSTKNNYEEAANVLLTHLPDWNKDLNMYYWYYGTLTMFQQQGHWWEQWNDALKKALVPTQETRTKGGHKNGSWDPSGDFWGQMSGRVYSTACGALSLMVYYRYLLVTGGKK